MKKYKNDYLTNIMFPLGGIGTGSIGLNGCGKLLDCEIKNKPNRDSYFGNTSFAVKAESEEKVIDWRMLFTNSERDLLGTMGGSYGHGPAGGLQGFKHFEKAEFCGSFPFAELKFHDSTFPADVKMNAFNPLIPSNEDDSSIPAAFFEISFKNTTNSKIRYTVAFSATNILASKGFNTFSDNGKFKELTLNCATEDKNSTDYSNITIATDCEHCAHQDYWFRGNWFDSATMFMNDFNKCGDIQNRTYNEYAAEKRSDTGTLTASVDVNPGESKTVKFIYSWYVPNYTAYWEKSLDLLKNYYANKYKSSSEVAEYCFSNWKRLYSDTKRFSKALYSSNLPAEVIDAIQGNIAILKSTTCLRLEDGSFWAWEGVHRSTGSCMGTCEHVWNYAYALPFLFPKLEKGVRSNELDHCLDDHNGLHFRMVITRDRLCGEGVCVDGQMGTVMKCYREWKLSGDDEWLKKYWNKIKDCIAYAWSPENPQKWDPDKSGVITGKQHHTLDVQLFGVHSWLTGFYLSALNAGAEMANALGDFKAKKEYLAISEKGQKLLDKMTFNGKYYTQNIDVSDEKHLKAFYDDPKNCYYWDKETKQIKYQIENGCEIDQVLADWHNDLIGIDKVFVPEHRKKALESIYKNNFVSMHDFDNPCRIFACNDEKGVVICKWPDGVKKPEIPIPYSEECMTGFEYAVACNMLQCGMEKEALEIVRSVRDRYDGKKRNPWAEIEWGASYSRAMASYSFLLTYSGFKYNLSEGMIGFIPKNTGNYFWSVDGAWGTVCYEKDSITLKVLYGALSLKKFVCDYNTVSNVTLNKKPVKFEFSDGTIHSEVKLTQNSVLIINK